MMKIQTIINILEKAKQKHGNLPVRDIEQEFDFDQSVRCKYYRTNESTLSCPDKRVLKIIFKGFI